MTLSAGEGCRKSFLEAAQTDRLQHPGYTLLHLRFLHLAQPEAERHIIIDRQMREQRIALEHEAEIPLFHRNLGVVLPAKHEIARFRIQESGDQPQRGCFAAAAGAEQREELSLFQRQIEILQY
ncbi:hypothetical protein D3C87_1681450 [compost metagenome]